MNKALNNIVLTPIFWILIFFIQLLPFQVFSRDYAAYTYDESVVPDIGDYHGMMQDSRGFIWFWGSGGAAYYDGQAFHRFGEHNGLASDYCYNIREFDGQIYICSYRGLDIYDFQSSTLTRHPVELISAFRDVWKGEDYLYVAGDAEVYAFKGNAHYRVFIKDKKRNKIIMTLCSDITPVTDKKFWVSTEYGGIYEINTAYIKEFLEFKDKEKQAELEEIGNPAFEVKYPGYTNEYSNFVIDSEEKRLDYTDKFQKLIALPDEDNDRFPVYSSIPDYKGKQYAFALGGFYEIIEKKFVSRNPSLRNGVKAIYDGGIDSFGRLYLFSNLGVHLYTDTDTIVYSNSNGLPGNTAHAFLTDRDENLWFAQSAGELSKIISGSLQIFSLYDYPFIANVVKAIPNPDGGLLLGGPNGFSILNNNGLKTRLELSEEIHDFAFDKNGNLIILTSNSISFADLKNESGYTLKYFKKTTEGRILLTRSPDGSIYITIAGKIFAWNGSKLSELKGMEYEAIFPICLMSTPDSSLYIGNWNGIARLKDNQETFFNRNFIAKGDVHDVVFPKDFENKSTYIDSFPEGYFERDIAAVCGEVGRDGAAWFGTFKAGIVRIEGDSIQLWDTRNGLQDNSIKTVYKDANGYLYFVSSNDIVKITDDGPETLNLNIPEDVQLENILIDRNNRFYFASKQGLWIQDGDRQLVLDRGIGLNESWVNFLSEDSDGNIVVIQPNNIFTFNPDSLLNSLTQNDISPLITSIKCNGLKISSKKRIELPKGYREFELTTTLPGYLNEERNRFAWKLEGLDKDFTDFTDNTNIKFERVPHGNYKLHIKAVDALGNESMIASPPIIVIPPFFWETYLFRISSIFALVGFVFLVSWLRMRSVRKRNTILENMVRSRTIELEEALVEVEKSKELEVETESLRAAQKLASSIAHEFNNPMAIIKGVVDLNRQRFRDNMDEMAAKHMDMVDRNLIRMTDLINKLLNITTLKEVQYTKDTTIYDLHQAKSEKQKNVVKSKDQN